MNSSLLANKLDHGDPSTLTRRHHPPPAGAAALTLRTFAELTGISNPYLSQIERGLRAPSDRVVAAIARSLEMNADDLYELAGIVEDDGPVASGVPAAIEADPFLTPRQRRALLGIYDALIDADPANRKRRRRARDASG